MYNAALQFDLKSEECSGPGMGNPRESTAKCLPWLRGLEWT